jgi:chromosome segregation ATPase
MIKLPNILLITLFLTTHTAGAQGVTEEEFLEINRQYTEAYFNYLQFKKETPLRAEKLKRDIESGRVTFEEAQVIFLREKRILSTLENELVSIVNEELETADNITEANQIIKNLKNDAVLTGMFSQNDVIDSGTITSEINIREGRVSSLSLTITELESEISTIKSTAEWVLLVKNFNTINTTLSSDYSKRGVLESDVNKYMTLITETNREINTLQDKISDLETEEAHLDNAFPGARRRVEDARNELTDIRIRLSDAEAQFNTISRERSSVSADQRRSRVRTQDLRTNLNQKNLKLDELERKIGRLPSLRSRLRELNNSKIPQLNNELQRAQGQVDQVRNTLVLNQRDLTTSTNTLKRSEDQKREAVRQLSTIDRQINTIKRKVQELKKEEANIGQYEQRLQSLNREKGEIERKLQRANSELQNAQNSVNDINQRRQSVNAQVRESNVKLDRIDSQRNQIKRKITQISNTITAYQAEIRKLERSGGSSSGLEQSLREAISRKADLEKRLQRNNRSAQNINRKKSDLDSRIQVLRDRAGDRSISREEKREILKEIKRISPELKKLSDDLAKTQANITRLSGAITKEDRTIANLRRQIGSGGDATRRIAELRQKIRDEEAKKVRQERQLSSKNREYNEQKSELTSLQQREQGIKAELAKAQARVRRSEGQVNSLRSDIANSDKLIKQTRSRLEKARDAKNEIIRLRSEIQKLGVTRSDFESKLSRAERRINELRSEISRMQVTTRRLEQDLSSLRSRRDEVSRRLSSLTGEAESIRTEIDRLSIYRAEADNLRNNEIPRVRSDLERATRELESTTLRLETINRDYQRLSVRFDNLKNEKLEAESLFETANIEFSRIDERMIWVKSSLTSSRAKVAESFRLLPEYRNSMMLVESQLKVLAPKIAKLESEFIVAKDEKSKFHTLNLKPLETKMLTQVDARTKVENTIDQYTELRAGLESQLANINVYSDRLTSLTATKVVVGGKIFNQKPITEASENEYRSKEADYLVSVNDLKALRNDIVLRQSEVKDLKVENDRALRVVR